MASLTADELAAIGKQPHKDDVHTLLDEIDRLIKERDRIQSEVFAYAYENRNLRGGIQVATDLFEEVKAERDRLSADLADAREKAQIWCDESLKDAGQVIQLEEDLTHARAQIAEMAAVLTVVEWSRWPYVDDVTACPSCLALEHEGHDSDCTLAAALASGKEATP